MTCNMEMKNKHWNERLDGLIKEKYHTKASFLKAYQARYHAGTQADVSRWCRVGKAVKGRNGKRTVIGFPTYETMNRIAAFFDVDIGYLTGETDFDTFEMERACKTLCIDKPTGKALHGVAAGYALGLEGVFHADEYRATIKYLTTSGSFPLLVKGLRNLAVSKYAMLYPKDRHVNAAQKVNPDILEFALECREYGAGEEPSDRVTAFIANNPEREQELRDAVFALNEAIDRDFCQSLQNEQQLKLAEYELQKLYFKLIEEITTNDHLAEMTFSNREVS